MLTEMYPRPGEMIVSEAPGSFSRDAVTIAASQTIKPGQVLGRVAGAATSAAASGNTGNGALTLADPAIGAGVKEGVWRIYCIEPAANGGVFAVEDPDGALIGRAVVGTAYAGPLAFTIADGATDFAAGDSFLIAVAVGTQWKALSTSATDGSSIARAVAFAGVVTAAGQTAQIGALTRNAELLAAALVWPSGITTNQRTAALADLARIGLITR